MCTGKGKEGERGKQTAGCCSVANYSLIEELTCASRLLTTPTDLLLGRGGRVTTTVYSFHCIAMF
ncbi:hypothetical protein PRIPAC_71657 [Pristionchus pacificus]|uniref:Uncharacterized protein n=1 Tax=Pristionchus pacificus TaxID=54126 RepID=A0A2A6BEI9_PRIPA|nr:hypothetical protein PRIPAC_71657 [Pristionchus pacificus]|eukprot:PDM64299.1 hypothetical protein PRIPAC_52555 [Pristionchus pacificus]